MSEENWDDVINTNLKSCFNLTKAISKIFLSQKYGSIINITSVVGVKGNAGQSNYAASKAGIIGFTKSIALELGARNIRCNAVAPGFISTEMTEKINKSELEEWKKGKKRIKGSEKNLGGTMRLGLYEAILKNNSLISKIYSEKKKN